MDEVELAVIHDVLHFVTEFKLLDGVDELEYHELNEIYDRSEKILTKLKERCINE